MEKDCRSPPNNEVHGSPKAGCGLQVGQGGEEEEADSSQELGAEKAPAAPPEAAPGLPVPAFLPLLVPPSLQVQASSALPSVAIATSISALAHLLQGTRQVAEVPVVLLQPQRSRITPVGWLGGKVVQVPDGGKEKDPGLPRCSAPPRGRGLRGPWEDFPRAPGLWVWTPQSWV